MSQPAKPFLDVVSGQRASTPPLWMMRQAGRYLPEYRKVRETAGGFLDLCFNPEFATEVTLQPIRRFGFDAAIIFSDILVIPYALGRSVRFEAGEGPRLDPLDTPDQVATLARDADFSKLDPVFEALLRVRAALDPNVTLIGFCGAPWTVATYMIAGRGTPDQAAALEFAKRCPDDLQALIDTLVEASADYLVAQIRAGADVVQIFDTWAGVLSGDDFDRWCLQPTLEIVSEVKANEPDARIIGFPKGVGDKLERYVTHTGVDGVSLDAAVPLDYAQRLQGHAAVQGNLDPEILLAGGAPLDAAVDRILAALSGGRFIFNLGHGILPTTPIGNVERLIARVRA